MHHLRDWVRGGETNVDNLLPLCSSCHSLVRHGSAKIWERNGHIHYRFADGFRYTAYNRAHPVREPDPHPIQRHQGAARNSADMKNRPGLPVQQGVSGQVKTWNWQMLRSSLSTRLPH